MQYILTEEEFKELSNKSDKAEKKYEQIERDLCTRVADSEPINWGWGGADPKPWGCIYTIEDEWYCDSCPVRKVCTRVQYLSP